MNTLFNPQILKWARIRAGLTESQLAKKVAGPKASSGVVKEWEASGQLSYSHATKLANATHTPFGYLFLEAPPIEKAPIKDFRVKAGASSGSVSLDLLQTIYSCQIKQAWYRDFLIDNGIPKRGFVGRFNISDDIAFVAQNIRKTLKIVNRFKSLHSDRWNDTFKIYCQAVSEAGILLMRSGVVGNSNNRPLSVDEFRGFALSDDYAPLIFINTNDSDAAILFTLAHELAHIWIGDSALSNPDKTYSPSFETEIFCNAVAAELLVPLSTFSKLWNSALDLEHQLARLSRIYKVSRLVIIRRAFDAGYIPESMFRTFYDHEIKRYSQAESRRKASKEGGTFHNNVSARSSELLCRAVIDSTIDGRTPYKEAFSLLGLNSTQSFLSFAKTRFGYSI